MLTRTGTTVGLGMAEIADDDLAEFWAAPRPGELPELRRALVEHMATPAAHHVLTATIAAGKGALVPPGPPDTAAARLLREECQRLREAQLFFLTEDMTELARVAGAGLPDFRLAREDLPAPAGFVQFGSPIGDYLEDGATPPQRTHIVACSWGPTSATTGSDKAKVWVSFWAPVNHPRMTRALAAEGYPAGEAKRMVHAMRGELSWDNEALLTLDGDDKLVTVHQNKVTATYDGGETGAETIDSVAVWAQTLRAAWLLMTQSGITDVDRQAPRRHQRRRDERDGYQHSTVAVVRLRTLPARPSGEHPDNTANDFTVRWMVRGHWRQQPYGPQRSLRRPVWINPHIKGPADAPLITKEKVVLIDRLPTVDP